MGRIAQHLIAIGKGRASIALNKAELGLRDELAGRGFVRGSSFLDDGLVAAQQDYVDQISEVTVNAMSAEMQQQSKYAQIESSAFISEATIKTNEDKTALDLMSEAELRQIDLKRQAQIEGAELSAEAIEKIASESHDSTLKMLSKVNSLKTRAIDFNFDLHTDLDVAVETQLGKEKLTLAKFKTKHDVLTEKTYWDREVRLYEAGTRLQKIQVVEGVKNDAAKNESNARIEAEESKLPAKIKAIEAKNGAEFDRSQNTFNARLSAMANESASLIQNSRNKTSAANSLIGVSASAQVSRNSIMNGNKLFALDISLSGNENAENREFSAKRLTLLETNGSEIEISHNENNAKAEALVKKLDSRFKNLQQESNSRLEIASDEVANESQLASNIKNVRIDASKEKAYLDAYLLNSEIEQSAQNLSDIFANESSIFAIESRTELDSERDKSNADIESDNRISNARLTSQKEIMDENLITTKAQVDAETFSLAQRLEADSTANGIRVIGNAQARLIARIADANIQIASDYSKARQSVMSIETDRHIAVENQRQYTKRIVYK